jgi:DNA-binding XRE family transcriptional regulator
MTDLEVLRQAQLLLAQYGFDEEQEALAKAIRIITAATRRLGMLASERPASDLREAAGDRLKRLRERAGLTRAQLADVCGVVTGTVRAHENNQAPLSLAAAETYSSALGVTAAMIMHGRDR